jgi:predicted N-acetyltransferase YhbS
MHSAGAFGSFWPRTTLEPSAYALAVEIRVENADDHAAVRKLHLAAFYEHGRVVAPLVEGLRAAHGESTLGLVAVDRAQVVGHVLFSPACSILNAGSSR